MQAVKRKQNEKNVYFSSRQFVFNLFKSSTTMPTFNRPLLHVHNTLQCLFMGVH